MKNYNYIPRNTKIVAKEELSPDTLLLRLKFTDRKPFNFIPGQFVMLSVLGFGEVPIGICSSPSETGFIEVAVRSAGMVTQKICSLNIGDALGVNGPFGNGFPVTKLKGKDVVLVAGGIGLFPLRSLILHFRENKKLMKSLTILTGARSPQHLVFRKEYKDWGKFARVYTTVDTCTNSWEGCVGNLTKLYKESFAKGSVMIVCAPPIVNSTIIERFLGKEVAEKDLYFDLERRIKCGIGKCQHCTCGKEYVCLDGPVFSYQELKDNFEAFPKKEYSHAK
jgi:NAD(P)H-flavin reductase